mgnify:CR=1 FL=1
MFDIQEELKKLPAKPGVYIMHDEKDAIIYVGKAVSLKNRVRQYFQVSRNKGAKIDQMVTRIRRFEYIVTDSELEALVLECNLIKKHRPFYNILLKDDKHYPYLRIDLNEPFPRLTLARNMDDQRAGVKYFGPYIGATAVRQVMDEVRRFFPLRTCNLRFPVKSPRRPCVHHQIGQCLAPCAGGVSEEAYRAILARVIDFLNGDSRELLAELTREMNVASARMEYEQAAALARAAERCEAALYAAQSGMTPDAVVMDAEGAITALGEITGETVTDAVVTRIFSDFCVGK